MRRPSCPRQVAPSLRDNPCRQSIGQNLPSGRAIGFCRDKARSDTGQPVRPATSRECVPACRFVRRKLRQRRNIKRFGKRRIAVSGQIKRADVPIGRQARYQIVKYMAVRRPTVYQINFFGGVWHECSFLVAQFETAQCATLRIMPRFRCRRPLPRLRKRFDGIFYRRGTKLPFVFPPCRGRGSVRQLSEKTARI